MIDKAYDVSEVPTATFTEDQVRSLSTREVYRYWGLVPFALEATVQRIKMWQSVLRNPANHAHFLSVFFRRNEVGK